MRPSLKDTTWTSVFVLLANSASTLAQLNARFTNATTTSPAITSTSTATTACPSCLLGAVPQIGNLGIVAWNTEILTITLDTVSPYVVQYNNTQITKTTTIYGNVSTLSAASIPALATLNSMAANQLYASIIDFVSGTASVYSSGSYSTTLVYPEGYGHYNAISYNSTTPGTCIDEDIFAQELLGFGSIPQQSVMLPEPIFASIGSVDPVVASRFGNQGGACPSAIFQQPDVYSSLSSALGFDPNNCYAIFCSGQPSFKVPVSALTSTVTGAPVYTVTSVGILTPSSASPQSSITPPTVTPSSTSSTEPTSTPVSSSETPSSTAPTSTAPGSTESSVVSSPSAPSSSIESPSASSPSAPSTSVESPSASSPSGQSPTTTAGQSPSSGQQSPSGTSPSGTEPLPSSSVAGSAPGESQSGSSVSYLGHSTTPSTTPVTAPSTPASTSVAIIIGGTTYTANPSGAYTLPEGTIYPGSTTTISGVPYYLSSTALVSGTVTLVVSPTEVTPGVIATAATSTSVGYYQVGTQTLSAGGSPITVSGTTYSLAPSGSAIVIAASGSSTTSSLAASGATTPAIVIGSSTYTETFAVTSNTLSTALSGSSTSTKSYAVSTASSASSAGASSSPSIQPYTGKGTRLASTPVMGYVTLIIGGALMLLI